MRGAHVEVERLLEVGDVGVEERVRDGAADVVDDRVEPAELVVRRLREAGDRVGVAEVGRDDERPPAGVADPLGDLLELVRGARGDDDVGAGLGERDGGGGADAAAGAGDDGDVVGEGEPVEDAHDEPPDRGR